MKLSITDKNELVITGDKYFGWTTEDIKFVFVQLLENIFWDAIYDGCEKNQVAKEIINEDSGTLSDTVNLIIHEVLLEPFEVDELTRVEGKYPNITFYIGPADWYNWEDTVRKHVKKNG